MSLLERILRVSPWPHNLGLGIGVLEESAWDPEGHQSGGLSGPSVVDVAPAGLFSRLR